ncbi:MAG TPA: hypothetical protein VHE12_04330 [bacterium]|nr:hypothetical protein [bacterium]
MPYGVMALQFLHLLFAGVLIGSTVFMNFVLWPVLLKRPSAESRAFFDASFKPVSVLMGASGGLTFLTGLLRGTVFGQIKTMADLSTAYGITFLVAAVLTLFMMIHGPRTGNMLLKAVWDGKKYRQDAAPKAIGIVRFSLVMILAIFFCMVLLHFGL